MQVLWLSFVMIPLYALNQQLVYATFKALDVGGSISIHAFGAYYGLAASLVLSRCASRCSCDYRLKVLPTHGVGWHFEAAAVHPDAII